MNYKRGVPACLRGTLRRSGRDRSATLRWRRRRRAEGVAPDGLTQSGKFVSALCDTAYGAIARSGASGRAPSPPLSRRLMADIDTASNSPTLSCDGGCGSTRSTTESGTTLPRTWGRAPHRGGCQAVIGATCVGVLRRWRPAKRRRVRLCGLDAGQLHAGTNAPSARPTPPALG